MARTPLRAGGFLRFPREFEGLDDPRAGDVTHRLRDMAVMAVAAIPGVIQTNRLQAGWDNDFLLQLISR